MQQQENFLEKYLDVLIKCNLFENIEAEDLESLLLCLNYRIKKYNKNEIIILPGDKVDFIGIVLDGTAEITKNNALGDSILLSKLNSSQIFAEAIVCGDLNISPVTVASLSESVIMYVSYNKIMSICSNTCTFHSRLIYNMVKIIAKKNIVLNDKIDLLSSKTIKEKINLYLSKQMEINKSNKFKISFSRSELADFLNVNRSSLSRELSNMQNEGLIKFNKNNFEIIP